MKFLILSILIIVASSFIDAVPIEKTNQRDISDFIVNSLGLGTVWSEIQNTGSNLVATLISEGMQLLFAGKEVVAQAKAILAQLVADLTNHTNTASTLVAAAVSQISEILKSNSFYLKQKS